MKKDSNKKQLHTPVLLKEILENISISDKLIGMDGTFGRGGHAAAVLSKYPNGFLLGLDQDEAAIDYGASEFKPLIDEKKLYLHKANFVDSKAVFNELKEKLGLSGFNYILLDLGVSSPQLDVAERGFSFYHSGPLDMRMNLSDELTAYDIVNTWSEDELTEVFLELGEVRRPQRVVKAILHDRKEKPFETTTQLSEMIARVEGWRKKGFHPATQYFMALRLQVNAELEVIEKVIPDLVDLLLPGGRLMVITFHSLEDRIVKYGFKGLLAEGRLVNKKVIKPIWDEQKKNPRARSAKLRIFEKSGGTDE